DGAQGVPRYPPTPYELPRASLGSYVRLDGLPMKRWAAITVTLYGLFLVLLTLPVCLLCWLQWHAQMQEWRWEIGFEDVMGLFRSGWYWLWLFVFLAAQALLLIVPVRTIERRPHGRRSIRLTIVTATFLLANLLFAGIFAVLAAWRGD